MGDYPTTTGEGFKLSKALYSNLTLPQARELYKSAISAVKVTDTDTGYVYVGFITPEGHQIDIHTERNGSSYAVCEDEDQLSTPAKLHKELEDMYDWMKGEVLI